MQAAWAGAGTVPVDAVGCSMQLFEPVQHHRCRAAAAAAEDHGRPRFTVAVAGVSLASASERDAASAPPLCRRGLRVGPPARSCPETPSQLMLALATAAATRTRDGSEMMLDITHHQRALA
eukprot:SAG31_NODE_259_length_18917_cov_28.559677_7_plen_121_part_00